MDAAFIISMTTQCACDWKENHMVVWKYQKAQRFLLSQSLPYLHNMLRKMTYFSHSINMPPQSRIKERR